MPICRGSKNLTVKVKYIILFNNALLFILKSSMTYHIHSRKKNPERMVKVAFSSYKKIQSGNCIINRKKKWNSSQMTLQAMAIAGMIWYLIFHYIPMVGLIFAFKEIDFRDLLAGQWVGLKYFKELFSDPEILGVIKNTFSIAILKLIFFFPVPLIFAVMLNEITNVRFKKFVQTVSYFPHFISWVILSLVLIYWFSPEIGIVNKIGLELNLLKEPIMPLANPDSFYALAVISEMWKETGWSAIIYIAAIAGIDQSLYEAATVDGATKLQKIFHITLPCIKGAFVILLLQNIGMLVSGGAGTFEQSFFLGNPMNYEKSMIVNYYTMKVGISMGRFSYATAVGLLNSTVSLTLLLSANALTKKMFGHNLFMEGD